MRLLYVFHESKFIYGANRSLVHLLKNLDFDYDIMISQSFTVHADEAWLRKELGSHLQKIYVCWLPRYRCQQYETNGLWSELSHWMNNSMAFLFAYRSKQIIRWGKYDFVHLNTLVLYPMINRKARYLIHVREIFNPGHWLRRKMTVHLRRAAGVIYIDSSTRNALKDYVVHDKELVLNNPFDMTHIQEIDYADSLQKHGVTEQNIIFSMLGQLSKLKGSQFVIEAFMEHKNEKSRLLIVGDKNHSYGAECEALAQRDPRIRFVGELTNTDQIYRISDYILRGDDQFCIGRTIYEGLYSGCGVIIPGDTSDLESLPGTEELTENIFFYQPENRLRLTARINECSQIKQGDRYYRNNIKGYLRSYYHFLETVGK